MKRKIFLCMAAAFCLAGAQPAHAASSPTVWLDGEQMSFEVAPVIQNDRTMVPYRAIFEELGYQVGWDAASRSVTAVKNSTTMNLTIGSKTVTVNGETVTSDAAPVIRQDRTLVPLRLVSEYSGCDVLWDAGTRTVAMYHKQEKNAMSEKLGCVTTDGDSLLVEHSDCVTRMHGTQGYSLVDLSPIAFLPNFVVQATYQGIGYGQIARGPVYSDVSDLGNYRAINMVTGETLAESPSDMLSYYSWQTLHLDPVQGTPYAAASIYDGEQVKHLFFQFDPVTLQVRQTFEGILTSFDDWFVYDDQLLVARSPQNSAQTELHQINLETGADSCVLQYAGVAKDYVPYKNELYILLSDANNENDEILVYNMDDKSSHSIPVPDRIASFDVTQNSIFYLTQSDTPSCRYPYALYRISKNGTLRTLLQDGIEWGQLDTFSTSLKVIGNTIYYYIRDYEEEDRIYNDYVNDDWDYEKHPYHDASVASLCALPTCGGTPYILDRSYWWRGPLMS